VQLLPLRPRLFSFSSRSAQATAGEPELCEPADREAEDIDAREGEETGDEMAATALVNELTTAEHDARRERWRLKNELAFELEREWDVELGSGGSWWWVSEWCEVNEEMRLSDRECRCLPNEDGGLSFGLGRIWWMRCRE
jgi:hypothetical protein